MARSRQVFQTREELVNLLAKHNYNVLEVNRKTGIGRNTINRACVRFDVNINHLRFALGDEESQVDETPIAEPAEIIQFKRKQQRIEAENRSLKAQLKTLIDQQDIVEQIKDHLAPIVASAVLPKPEPLGSVKPSDATPLTLVWHLTDLHWGEIVEAKSINLANAYSPLIAAQRLQHTVDVIRNIVADNKAGYDELVIALNGDTIGGSIHPDSTIYYASAFRQSLDVALVLAQVVRELRSIFKIVRVLVTTGNHPRTTHRTPVGGKARVETSYELVIAEYMAALLAQDKNVSFEIADGYTLLTEICGEQWAFSHGDGTSGGGGQLGIPAYGLKRAHDANREWSIVVAELTEQTINSIVKHSRYGHFHTYFYWVAGSADILLAPSPKGVDPYVKDKLGKYSPPMFVLESVHKKHKEINLHKVDLRHIMHEDTTRYQWNTNGGMTVDYWAA